MEGVRKRKAKLDELCNGEEKKGFLFLEKQISAERVRCSGKKDRFLEATGLFTSLLQDSVKY